MVVLYLLGRKIMPPVFAGLAPLLFLAIDTAPLMWEPHPAWYALFFALLAVWSVSRLIQTGSDRWTVAAGLAAAASALFKQNIGIFILLAAVGFPAFFESRQSSARLVAPDAARRWLGSSRLWMAVRWIYSVGLAVRSSGCYGRSSEPRLGVVMPTPGNCTAGDRPGST